MNRNDGFTLVEVLVATFIMSLLSIMGLIMLDSAYRSKDISSSIISEIQSLERARSIIKNDLVQTIGRRRRDKFGNPSQTFFEGGADLNNVILMQFVRNGNIMPGLSNEASSIEYVEYRFENSNLIRKSYARVDVVNETPAYERVLLRDISDVKFQFFDGSIWLESWRGGGSSTDLNGFPFAVSLALNSKRYGSLEMKFLTSAGG